MIIQNIKLDEKKHRITFELHDKNYCILNALRIILQTQIKKKIAVPIILENNTGIHDENVVKIFNLMNFVQDKITNFDIKIKCEDEFMPIFMDKYMPKTGMIVKDHYFHTIKKGQELKLKVAFHEGIPFDNEAFSSVGNIGYRIKSDKDTTIAGHLFNMEYLESYTPYFLLNEACSIFLKKLENLKIEKDIEMHFDERDVDESILGPINFEIHQKYNDVFASVYRREVDSTDIYYKCNSVSRFQYGLDTIKAKFEAIRDIFAGLDKKTFDKINLESF